MNHPGVSSPTLESQPAPGAKRPERVLGIDPGLNVTGYAVLEAVPGLSKGARILEAGVIRTQRATQDLGERLGTLHQGVLEILDAFPVSAMAIEQVHTHLKRPRTAVLMAHARGVILLAAQLRQVTVHGYAAARIKKSLTGSGRAPKDQMQRAIQLELKLRSLPEPHDVADACAAALCHMLTSNLRAMLGEQPARSKSGPAHARNRANDASDDLSIAASTAGRPPRTHPP